MWIPCIAISVFTVNAFRKIEAYKIKEITGMTENHNQIHYIMQTSKVDE